MRIKDLPYYKNWNSERQVFDKLKSMSIYHYERIKQNLESIEDFGKVKVHFDGFWVWFINPNSKELEAVTGKYLFFSKDDLRLYNIAIEEINNNKFYEAKVNSYQQGSTSKFVLCLYFRNDSRKYELAAKYKRLEGEVDYRYWKSEEDTLEGKYSKEFLKSL